MPEEKVTPLADYYKAERDKFKDALLEIARVYEHQADNGQTPTHDKIQAIVYDALKVTTA